MIPEAYRALAVVRFTAMVLKLPTNCSNLSSKRGVKTPPAAP